MVFVGVLVGSVERVEKWFVGCKLVRFEGKREGGFEFVADGVEGERREEYMHIKIKIMYHIN